MAEYTAISAAEDDTHPHALHSHSAATHTAPETAAADEKHIESLIAAAAPQSTTTNEVTDAETAVDLDSVQFGNNYTIADTDTDAATAAPAPALLPSTTTGGGGSASFSTAGRRASDARSGERPATADWKTRDRSQRRFKDHPSGIGGGSGSGFGFGACKNGLYVILFGIVSLLLAIANIADLELHPSSARESYILVMCSVLSAGLGLLCLFAWIWAAPVVLWLAPPLSLGCMLAFGVYLLLVPSGSIAVAVSVLSVGTLFTLWWYRQFPDVKDFATLVLDAISSTVTAGHSVLLMVVAVIVLVQTVWSCFMSISAVQAITATTDRSQKFTLAAFLFFGWYWTSQVFKHIVHCVTAGSVAHRYFKLPAMHVINPPDVNHPIELEAPNSPASDTHSVGAFDLTPQSSPAPKSTPAAVHIQSPSTAGSGGRSVAVSDPYVTVWCLKRSLWSSFGSVCFGSLFVTPVYLLSALTRTVTGWFGGSSATACLCERLTAAVESAYRSVNEYGWTHVMLYGSDFVSSSRDSWEQFFVRGVDEIVGKDQVDKLLLFPSIGGACLMSLICAIWSRAPATSGDSGVGLVAWQEMALVLFLVAYAQIALTSQLIEAALAALLSCFAEEPHRLSDTHPILFHRFVRIAEFSSFQRSPAQL